MAWVRSNALARPREVFQRRQHLAQFRQCGTDGFITVERGEGATRGQRIHRQAQAPDHALQRFDRFQQQAHGTGHAIAFGEHVAGKIGELTRADAL